MQQGRELWKPNKIICDIELIEIFSESRYNNSI